MEKHQIISTTLLLNPIFLNPFPPPTTHTHPAPYLPDLVRLVLLSSAVHAAAFVALSSMPFAVGQVQDAGLIFLSSMTTTVAEYCRARSLSDEVLLSTALVVVALATATLGLALIGIGRLGLASIVQVGYGSSKQEEMLASVVRVATLARQLTTPSIHPPISIPIPKPQNHDSTCPWRPSEATWDS